MNSLANRIKTAAPARPSARGATRRAGTLLTALQFLLPNVVGFLGFTLFPVLFAFGMAFTNWTLKPAVRFQFVGLQNFADVLGVRPLAHAQPGLLAGWLLCALAVAAGLGGALWAAVAGARGLRAGGALFALLGLGLLAGAARGAGQGVLLPGLAALVAGAALLRREEDDWRPGWGTLPPVLIALGAAGLAAQNAAMWRAYTPRDSYFWQYLYNTLYLMLGIPFSIGGSLALALLLHEELPLGRARTRIVGAALCVGAGGLTWIVTRAALGPDAALIGALVWAVAALGAAFNVVAFRTLFYLPTFTAGVALMILWKALYNPQTGPIDVALGALLHHLGSQAQPPQWLSDVAWAKPALILMGVWTSIGGTNMLLYLAGLSNVPTELLDAAAVDGANAWQRFRHVTWPQLAPTTFFITIMAVIGGLQGGFEQARVMTGGGPAGSTTTLSYYIYNKAFQDLDLGYAAAISWVLFAVVFVATALNWKFGRGLEVEG